MTRILESTVISADKVHLIRTDAMTALSCAVSVGTASPQHRECEDAVASANVDTPSDNRNGTGAVVSPRKARSTSARSKRYRERHPDRTRARYDLRVADVLPHHRERFWSRTEQHGECWHWTGTTNGRYGVASFGSQLRPYAHRAAWVLTYGDFDQALVVCHRCDNPICVRPDHLFLGTSKDNTADMIAKGRSRAGEWQRARTHCPSGHRLVMRPKGDRRFCPVCNRERNDRKRRAEGRPSRGPYLTRRIHGTTQDFPTLLSTLGAGSTDWSVIGGRLAGGVWEVRAR